MSKRIRLQIESYSVPGTAWLVTIGVQNRGQRALADHNLSAAIMKRFSDSCESRGALLHLAVILPDHAHLIVEVTTGNLVALMRDLKSWTTRMWWERGGAGPLWQKSFRDRGLRSRKAFAEAARYVLENPIRLGLPSTWEEYPFIVGKLLIEG